MLLMGIMEVVHFKIEKKDSPNVAVTEHLYNTENGMYIHGEMVLIEEQNV